MFIAVDVVAAAVLPVFCSAGRSPIRREALARRHYMECRCGTCQSVTSDVQLDDFNMCRNHRKEMRGDIFARGSERGEGHRYIPSRLHSC